MANRPQFKDEITSVLMYLGRRYAPHADADALAPRAADPLGLRKRHSSGSSASHKNSTEDLKQDPAMGVLTNGSQTSLSPEQIKHAANITVTRVSSHDSSSFKSTNDTETRTVIHSSRSSARFQITRVIEVAKKVRSRLVRELDEVDDAHFKRSDLECYLGYIADERLIHMPKRGSQWDRVLKEAEFFGLQMNEFTIAVKDFIPDSVTIRNTALGSCYLLLELGCEQAEALEPTFNILYELAELLDDTLELRDVFLSSEAISHDLGEVLICLVNLLGDIAVFYRRRINRLSGTVATIDFDREFGSHLEVIGSKRGHLLHSIWNYKLGGDRATSDIESLHRKLGASRTNIKSYVYGRIHDKKSRAEGTCEWIEEDLVDFIGRGEDILAITGNAGCGKSMLAAWVRHRLQRPIAHLERKQETVSFTFVEDDPDRSTLVVFLKSLLSQLLQINIGDIDLFNQLSALFEGSKEETDANKLASQLWTALHTGLVTMNKNGINLTITVDGLDEIAGGESKAQELYMHLHKSINKLSSIRAVTFSRPISHLGQPGCKHLVITPEHVRDDIKLYLKERLATNITYSSQSEKKKQTLLGLLVSRARGSFLFASLSLQLLDTSIDFDSYQKLIEGIKSDSSKPHDGLLDVLVSKVNLKDNDVNHLFAFMVAAHRPLTIDEVEELLCVDLRKRTISSSFNVQKILSATRGLIVEKKGVVRFRHSVVRNHILGLCGSSLLSMQDAHRQLTMTMLFFAKTVLTQAYDPSLEQLNTESIDKTIHSRHVVEYIVYHWLTHFRLSSLMGPKGDLTLPADFKDIFPDSTLFSMMEWACWRTQPVLYNSIHMHNLSLRIRTACFGEKHLSVLQNMIILGTLYRTQSDTTKAAEFFYRASTIGQIILYKFCPLVVSCATIFLACTENIIFTKETSVVTWRVEMIRFIIEVYKGQHGAQSDTVIRWYEALVKLYRDVHDEYMVSLVLKELHEITILRFGRGSDQERGLARKLAGMNVVLKKGKPQQEKGQYDDLLFEASEEMELTDELRITIILSLAKKYEVERKFFLAEKLYISLWGRICEACRLKSSLELHLVQLSIALEYIHFLHRLKRNDEACNIMVCLWTEYEYRAFESQTITLRLKELAILFRSFGMLTVSVSILNRVWGWFRERNMVEHEEATSTTVIITEVAEEITETTTETTTTTTVTETLTREVFETTYTRCKSGKVDQHFFKAFTALVNLHLKFERWTEAEIVLRKSLELVWKGVLSIEGKLTIEGSFISESITAATHLALCYRRQRLVEKAEHIYLQVWRACLASLQSGDSRLWGVSLSVIEFYEEYHRHEKIIDIYKELLQQYRKQLGTSHRLTIQLLYKIASVYMLLGRKEAYDHYSEIVAAYTHNRICHHDGFQAAAIVLKFYREEQRWTELQKLCVVLWETIVRHHEETEVSEEFFQLVYEQYRFVLEFHAKVEFSILYKLTVEYRETVKKRFGVSISLYFAALIALAEICEKNEEHYHESVTVYEEIITKSKTVTTLTESKIRTVKKRLSTLYVTIITSGKKIEATSVERALVVCFEAYEQLRIELGWWHKTTLLKLNELVLMHCKLRSEKWQTIIIGLLQESVIKIITTATVAMDLYSSATTLASIYKAVKLESHSNELLRQLRFLILFPGFDATEQKISIKWDKKPSKIAFLFLIAFEDSLNAKGEQTAWHFSQIMADLLMETLLYEQYMEVTTTITETTSIELVLEHAARLRCLWVTHGRASFVAVLDKKLFALFTTRYAKSLSTHINDKDAVFELYVAILSQIGIDTATERATVDFALATCKAVNTVVRNILVEKKDLPRAHAVAKCGFHFANSQRFYHGRQRGVLGYKLAELLAGHNVPAWKTADSSLKESMLVTSRNILQFVVVALREAGVDFVSLRFEDLSSLVSLLGDQKNYHELESLLRALWRSREVQRSWSPDVVLRVGLLLVDAYVSAGHTEEAITLADTLYYNLRQSRGGLSTEALNFADKLTVLLIRAGRTREAARIHTDVLSDLDTHRLKGNTGKGNERLRAEADSHLNGLRRCGWASRNEGVRTAKGFQDRLSRRYGSLKVLPVEKWSTVDVQEELTYSVPQEWNLVVSKETGSRDFISPALERWGVRMQELVAA
ncbi:hypothetical protein F5B20DRAFT_582167 [Whalleya microplaca]|nr:hypothetical protein F5B20DRAFT_582167 [Whalleya microplaca]